LLPLHCYSSAALQAVTVVLGQHLAPALVECGLAAAGSEGVALAPSLRFAGLTCLGPSKLVATIADEDAIKLRSLAAQLHGHLAPWAEAKSPSTVPHVTLLKITWVLGDKKGKAAANQVAKRLAMHRSDWWVPMQGGFREAEVAAEGWSLLEMHPGGGASMGDVPHEAVWSQCGRQQENRSEPASGAAARFDSGQTEPEPMQPSLPSQSPVVQVIPALLLDDAVAYHIFKHLDPLDCLLGASLVCTQWRQHTREICKGWFEEFFGEDRVLSSLLSVSGLC
jgi:hypothetical protein